MATFTCTLEATSSTAVKVSGSFTGGDASYSRPRFIRLSIAGRSVKIESHESSGGNNTFGSSVTNLSAGTTYSWTATLGYYDGSGNEQLSSYTQSGSVTTPNNPAINNFDVGDPPIGSKNTSFAFDINVMCNSWDIKVGGMQIASGQSHAAGTVSGSISLSSVTWGTKQCALTVNFPSGITRTAYTYVTLEDYEVSSFSFTNPAQGSLSASYSFYINAACNWYTISVGSTNIVNGSSHAAGQITGVADFSSLGYGTYTCTIWVGFPSSQSRSTGDATVTLTSAQNAYIYATKNNVTKWWPATPYIYTSSGWKEAKANIYSSGWKS